MVKVGSLVPVFAGSTAKDIGVAELLDGIVSLMPNPLERVRKAEDGTEKVWTSPLAPPL